MPAFSTPADVWNSFQSLLAWYFRYAWPFMLVHLGLVWLIVRQYRIEIRPEIEALRSWDPAKDRSGTECTRVLSQFVRSARQWAAHGVLVPITDFSDRLDSRVTGVLEKLHDRINLLLITGIAGTFFAMFTFAAEAAQIIRQANPATVGMELSNALTQGLAHAFPVGFFGLVLTMAGHIWASYPERKLRSGLTEATQRALEARGLAVRGPLDAVAESMAPFRNLQDTLSGSLEPVIESFRGQLRETSALIQGQFELLGKAASVVEQSVQPLRTTAAQLEAALRMIPDTVENVARLQQDAGAQLRMMSEGALSARTALEASAGELSRSAEGLAALPRQLREQLVASLEEAAIESRRILQEVNQELLRTLGPVRQETEGTAGRLREAAAALAAVPGQVSASLEKAASEFSASSAVLAAACEASFNSTSRTFFTGFENRLVELTQRVQTSSELACGNLSQASLVLKNYAAESRALMTSIIQEQFRSTVEAIRPQLGDLERALVERYPQAMANLVEAMNASDKLFIAAHRSLEHYQRILPEMEAAMEKWHVINREIAGAVEKIRSAEFHVRSQRLDETAGYLRTIDGSVRRYLDGRPKTIRERVRGLFGKERRA
jgi:hypothetical protein